MMRTMGLIYLIYIFLCVCGWIKVAMIFQLLLTSQILPFSSLDHLSFFCVNKQQHYNHVCCVTGKSFPTLLHQFVNIGWWSLRSNPIYGKLMNNFLCTFILVYNIFLLFFMAFFSWVILLTYLTLRHAFLSPLGQRLRSYLNIIHFLWCSYEHPNHNLA